VPTHEADEMVILLGGEAVKHDVADQLGVGLAGLDEGEGREEEREGGREGGREGFNPCECLRHGILFRLIIFYCSAPQGKCTSPTSLKKGHEGKRKSGRVEGREGGREGRKGGWSVPYRNRRRRECTHSSGPRQLS